MKCNQCNESFESKRKDAKFCSARCRVTANRVTDNPPESVTDKSEVSKELNHPDFEMEKCHGCKEDVPEIVCICLPCITKGVRHADWEVEPCG